MDDSSRGLLLFGWVLEWEESVSLERLQALRELPENERGRVLPVLERVLEHGSYTAASSLAGQLLLGFCGLLTAGLCLVVLRERLPLLALVFMVWQVRNCVYTGPRLASLVFAGPGQLWPCWTPLYRG